MVSILFNFITKSLQSCQHRVSDNTQGAEILIPRYLLTGEWTCKKLILLSDFEIFFCVTCSQFIDRIGVAGGK